MGKHVFDCGVDPSILFDATRIMSSVFAGAADTCSPLHLGAACADHFASQSVPRQRSQNQGSLSLQASVSESSCRALLMRSKIP